MASWTVQYEANQLPHNASPSWTRTETDPAADVTYSVSGGELTLVVNDTDSGANPFIYWERTSSGVTGLTMEARVKVTSWPSFTAGAQKTKFYLGVGTSSRAAGVSVRKDAGGATGDFTVSLTNGIPNPIGDSTTVVATTTQAFDNYVVLRITVDGNDAKVYINGTLRMSTTLSSAAQNRFRFGGLDQSGSAKPAATTVWDYVYYSEEGAFTPTELPAVAAPFDLCDVPERVNTILDGRSAFDVISEPSRPFAAVYHQDYHLGIQRPAVVTWIDAADVSRHGINTYQHLLKMKTWVLYEDFKQKQKPTLGELTEDVRAAFAGASNTALDELTWDNNNIMWVRFQNARVLYDRGSAQKIGMEIDLQAGLERRFTDTGGTFAAGTSDIYGVARALKARLEADTDFAGVEFLIWPVPQANRWPACFITPTSGPLTRHDTDEHQTFTYDVIFEDKAYKTTRTCRLYGFVRDLDDRLHAENTLNGTAGVRNAYLTGYRQAFGRTGDYFLDRMICSVSVEVEK